MTFEYVSVEQAMARGGLRMVVVGDVPSPWGEAAKGTLMAHRDMMSTRHLELPLSL